MSTSLPLDFVFFFLATVSRVHIFPPFPESDTERQDKFLIQAGQLQEDHADAGDPKVLIDALPKEALFDQKLM
jgi:hypothetical protein